jgi:casein kinase II subunit beta
VEVDEEFIDDEFNLAGLSEQVDLYYDSLDMIQDIESETDYDEDAVAQCAQTLYFLIHQRYLLSRVGQALLVRIFFIAILLMVS